MTKYSIASEADALTYELPSNIGTALVGSSGGTSSDISADGNYIAVTDDPNLLVFNASDNSLKFSVDIETAAKTIAFQNNGNLVVIGNSQSKVYPVIYDVVSELEGVALENDGKIRGGLSRSRAVFNNTDTKVYSLTSYDYSSGWDVSTGNLLPDTTGLLSLGEYRYSAHSPTSPIMCISSKDNPFLNIFDTSTDPWTPISLPGGEIPANFGDACCFSSDGTRFYFSVYTGSVEVYDVNGTTFTKIDTFSLSRPKTMGLSTDDNYILTGTYAAPFLRVYVSSTGVQITDAVPNLAETTPYCAPVFNLAKPSGQLPVTKSNPLLFGQDF